jgi:hypothetical protein
MKVTAHASSRQGVTFKVAVSATDKAEREKFFSPVFGMGRCGFEQAFLSELLGIMLEVNGTDRDSYTAQTENDQGRRALG